MTDHQFLGVPTSADNSQIKNALIKKIAALDFEIDIENIFNYIYCSQRIIQKTPVVTPGNEVLITEECREVINNFSAEVYDTPEKLINHFKIVYDNPSTRFNKLVWKSALESLNTIENRDIYVKPVIDFLNEKPFLKSDVLSLMIKNLPLQQFFVKDPSHNNEEFWNQYGLIHDLLRSGNFILDLHADEINTGKLTTQQLDDIYNRLMMSTHYSRTNRLSEAFNALSGIPADVKPLLVWQRELNLLYKAVVVEKTETISELFLHTINSALSAFPDDEHLLYVRAKYLFHFYTPEDFRDEIIITLKKIPSHHKCLFLLGKCYMKLGVARAALVIFENLKKLNPLNMQYVTAAALASRKYIDFCIREHDPKDNDKDYNIKMITTLIEKEMFDEVFVFAEGAQQEDPDIKALLILSKDIEGKIINGTKNKKELLKAISYTNDKEIIQKIKEHYLKGTPDWEDIKAEKDFIIDYYKAYPNNSNANYEMGMLYFAETDHENAYEYLLKAKEIDPSDMENYYNLARVTKEVGLYSEAMEYSAVYLRYNNYNVIVNDVYCGCAYAMKDYIKTHNTAKWILSICRDYEFDPKYFFYFTASLSYYMDSVPKENYNVDYINEALALYDQYPKPATFWISDNGSKSMYWAAMIFNKIGNYRKAVEYLENLLQNVQEYNWELRENCLFKLLPECLYNLQEFNKLIQIIESPTLQELEKQSFPAFAAPASLYLSHSYSELGNPEPRMQWALNCANCYMSWNDPPLDWVDEFLLKNIVNCLELQLHEHAILLGNAYFKYITIIKDNHIWLAHNLANSYLAINRKEEALRYHRMCIEFGEIVSLEFQEIIDSQNFVKSYN